MQTIFKSKTGKFWQIERDGMEAETTSAYREVHNVMQRFFKIHPGVTQFKVIIERLDKIGL